MTLSSQNSEKKTSKEKTEDSEAILFLLDSGNYQIYNREVARALGSINAAILLSELVNRYRYHLERQALIENDEGQWFYYTLDKCMERTCLSFKEQRNAIKILEKFELFKKKSMGLPAKRYFQINISKITNFILNSNNFSRSAERAELDLPKGQNYPIKNSTKEPQENYYKESFFDRPDKKEKVVVVFDCLKKLKLPDKTRKRLSRKFSEQHLNLAVERTLRWTSRRNDEAALMTVLSRMDEWNDDSDESKRQENQESLDKIRHLDGKKIKGINVIIGSNYAEFSQGPTSCYTMIEDDDFEKNISKYLNLFKEPL